MKPGAAALAALLALSPLAGGAETACIVPVAGLENDPERTARFRVGDRLPGFVGPLIDPRHGDDFGFLELKGREALPLAHPPWRFVLPRLGENVHRLPDGGAVAIVGSLPSRSAWRLAPGEATWRPIEGLEGATRFLFDRGAPSVIAVFGTRGRNSSATHIPAAPVREWTPDGRLSAPTLPIRTFERDQVLVEARPYDLRTLPGGAGRLARFGNGELWFQPPGADWARVDLPDGKLLPYALDRIEHDPEGGLLRIAPINRWHSPPRLLTFAWREGRPVFVSAAPAARWKRLESGGAWFDWLVDRRPRGWLDWFRDEQPTVFAVLRPGRTEPEILPGVVPLTGDAGITDPGQGWPALVVSDAGTRPFDGETLGPPLDLPLPQRLGFVKAEPAGEELIVTIDEAVFALDRDLRPRRLALPAGLAGSLPSATWLAPIERLLLLGGREPRVWLSERDDLDTYWTLETSGPVIGVDAVLDAPPGALLWTEAGRERLEIPCAGPPPE